jgi:hypothetical protein
MADQVKGHPEAYGVLDKEQAQITHVSDPVNPGYGNSLLLPPSLERGTKMLDLKTAKVIVTGGSSGVELEMARASVAKLVALASPQVFQAAQPMPS